jgi:hypothetical protein
MENEDLLCEFVADVVDQDESFLFIGDRTFIAYVGAGECVVACYHHASYLGAF